MTFTFNVERDDLTPLVRGLEKRLASKRQMNAAVAQGMTIPIKRNFLQLSSDNHNPFGVKSTFWALMNAGTRPGADDSAGWIAMPRPVALRYFGGTVYPGAGKQRLSIPVRSEAYGKSPRDFPDLSLAFLGKGPDGPTLGLVQNEQTKIGYRKTKGGVKVVRKQELGGGLFFLLVKSATIRPDPRVLPTHDILTKAGVDALSDYLGHLGRRHQS